MTWPRESVSPLLVAIAASELHFLLLYATGCINYTIYNYVIRLYLLSLPFNHVRYRLLYEHCQFPGH